MSLNTTAWTPPSRGALFVVTGPSGSGKTTLVRQALDGTPGLTFSVSATTRPIRVGEQDGVDYHFLDRPSFMSKVEAGEFLEWAEVYGNCYGTLKAPIDESQNKGQSILLDIDTQGAQQVRATGIPHTSIFILPPSTDELERRLASRATDSADVINRRMEEAHLQLNDCGAFDYLVVNDELPSAHDQFQAIIISELLKTCRHPNLVSRFSD